MHNITTAKKLININDRSNMNKQAQFLLSPMLLQNYSSMNVEIETPKFDLEMHELSKRKVENDH